MADISARATVELDVNGSKSESVLERLEKRASDFADAMAEAAKAGDKVNYEKYRRELKKTNAEIKKVRSETKNVEEAMRNLDKQVPKELKKLLKDLTKELDKIERGSEAWDSQVEKIKRVKAELESVNNELKLSEGFWSRLKNKVSEWWTFAAGAAAAVAGLGVVVKNAVNDFAEMQQEMANVRKYTGMSEADVEDLNEAFKGMDTRTSREDLNKLAQEAGRLGKQSKEDVLGFVRAADQINVALDDLGEGATLTLSKLAQIFGDEQRLGTEKALLSVGSVINELSQNCAASAPYLTEFAKRMGGVGAQAGMTVQQIMGIAAVLDSKGQALEASATAVSQVITRMYQDPSKYAKAAGLDVKEFADLVRKDANEALIVLSEALNAKGGLRETAPLFKEMGENGARAVATLATLAENIEEVRAQQEAANVAFDEATSIGAEFDVQNNTVMAGLDKAKKSFKELTVELGEKLQPIAKYFISSSSLIVRSLLELINFVIKYKYEIIEVGTAIAAYTVYVNLATIKTKLFAASAAVAKGATAAWVVVQQGWNVVTALCSGNMHRLTQEVKLFSAMMKMNPFGLALTAVTALVVAITALNHRMSEAEKTQRAIADAESEAAKEAKRELYELESLYKKSQDLNSSMGERLKAAQKLKEMHPDTFKNLSAEAIVAGEAAKAYKSLAESIEAAAKAKVYRERIEKAVEEKIGIEESREKIVEELKKRGKANPEEVQEILNSGKSVDEIVDALIEYARSTSGKVYRGGANYATPGAMAENQRDPRLAIDSALLGLEAKTEKLAEVDGRIEKLEGKISALEDKGAGGSGTGEGNGDGTGEGNGDGTGDGTGGSDPAKSTKDRFKAEDEWRKAQEAENRIAYATGQRMYRSYVDRMLEIERDYIKKKLEHTDLSNLEKLQLNAELAEAEKKIADGESAKEIARMEQWNKVALAMTQQKFIDGKISKEEYGRQIEFLELAHLRLMVKVTKEGTEERAKAEENFRKRQLEDMIRKQKEVEEAERKHQEELARLRRLAFGMSESEKAQILAQSMAMLDELEKAEVAKYKEGTDERIRIESAFTQIRKELARQAAAGEDISLEKAIESIKEKSKNGAEGAKDAIVKTYETLVGAMSSIFSQMTSIIQAETEIQTAAIKSKYDKEIEMAQGNSYKVAKLEKKKEDEIAKIKNEANRKMYNMQVFQAVAQTAQNAISAYGSAAAIPLVGYIIAPIAAAAAVAAGILQVGAIKKQQQASEAQGYAEGGFTRRGPKYEPAGVVHAGEWVASQRLVNSTRTRPVIDALEYAQRTNTVGSFSVSPYPVAMQQQPQAIEVSRAHGGNSPRYDSSVVEVLSRLTERLNEPFVTVNTVTGDKGVKAAQDEYSRMIDNVTPKSKRK